MSTEDPVRATVFEDDETEALDIVYAWLGGDRAARTLLTRPEYDSLTANIAQALADRSATPLSAAVPDPAEVERAARVAFAEAQQFAYPDPLMHAVRAALSVRPAPDREAGLRAAMRDLADELEATAMVCGGKVSGHAFAARVRAALGTGDGEGQHRG